MFDFFYNHKQSYYATPATGPHEETIFLGMAICIGQAIHPSFQAWHPSEPPHKSSPFFRPKPTTGSRSSRNWRPKTPRDPPFRETTRDHGCFARMVRILASRTRSASSYPEPLMLTVGSAELLKRSLRSGVLLRSRGLEGPKPTRPRTRHPLCSPPRGEAVHESSPSCFPPQRIRRMGGTRWVQNPSEPPPWVFHGFPTDEAIGWRCQQ